MDDSATPFGVVDYGDDAANYNETAELTADDILIAVAKAVPLVSIVFFTVVGNILVLLAVITTPKLRTTTHYFIVNLAIADMTLGAFVLPLSATYEVLGHWIFGQFLCDLWLTGDVLCCTASIYSLCVISIDRYIGVSKPLVHSRIVNKRRAIVINCGVWLLSLTICVGPWLGWKLPGVVSSQCMINEEQGYVIFSMISSFYLPCSIVMIVYWRIYLKAVQQTRSMKLGYKEAKVGAAKFGGGKNGAGGENGNVVVMRIHVGQQQSTTGMSSGGNGSNAAEQALRQKKLDWSKFKRERRAARTLGIVVGVFIASWIGFFLLLPLNSFCQCVPERLFKIVFWLGYCNSLMNPFIYGADSREFRSAFKRLLCGRRGFQAGSTSTLAPVTPRLSAARPGGGSFKQQQAHGGVEHVAGHKQPTTTTSSRQEDRRTNVSVVTTIERSGNELSDPGTSEVAGAVSMISVATAEASPKKSPKSPKSPVNRKASDTPPPKGANAADSSAASVTEPLLLQPEFSLIVTGPDLPAKVEEVQPTTLTRSGGSNARPKTSTPTTKLARRPSTTSSGSLSSPSSSSDDETTEGSAASGTNGHRKKRHHRQDLASLAFRRLLTVRLARRWRSENTTTEATPAIVPTAQQPQQEQSRKVPSARWRLALTKLILQGGDQPPHHPLAQPASSPTVKSHIDAAPSTTVQSPKSSKPFTPTASPARGLCQRVVTLGKQQQQQTGSGGSTPEEDPSIKSVPIPTDSHEGTTLPRVETILELDENDIAL